VMMKVHGDVAGTGKCPSSGTVGPTAVASTRPLVRWTETVSPWIASTGWVLLACTTRPTGIFAFGSQLGRPPYLADRATVERCVTAEA
jgi:hypothetical protein